MRWDRVTLVHSHFHVIWKQHTLTALWVCVSIQSPFLKVSFDHVLLCVFIACMLTFYAAVTACVCALCVCVHVFRGHRLRLFSLGVSFRSRKCTFRSGGGSRHAQSAHICSNTRDPQSHTGNVCVRACVHVCVCVHMCVLQKPLFVSTIYKNIWPFAAYNTLPQ